MRSTATNQQLSGTHTAVAESQNDDFTPQLYMPNQENHPLPKYKNRHVFIPKQDQYYVANDYLSDGSFATLIRLSQLDSYSSTVNESENDYVLKIFTNLSRNDPKSIRAEYIRWNQAYKDQPHLRAYIFNPEGNALPYLITPYGGEAHQSLHQDPIETQLLKRIAVLEALIPLAKNRVKNCDLLSRNVCLKTIDQNHYRALIIDFGKGSIYSTDKKYDYILNAQTVSIFKINNYDFTKIVFDRHQRKIEDKVDQWRTADPSQLLQFVIGCQKYLYAKLMFLHGKYDDALEYLAAPVMFASIFPEGRTIHAKAVALQTILSRRDLTPGEQNQKKFLIRAFKILHTDINSLYEKQDEALVKLGECFITGVDNDRCSAAFLEIERLKKTKGITNQSYIRFHLLKYTHHLVGRAGDSHITLTDFSKGLATYNHLKGFFRTQTDTIRDLREIETYATTLKLATIPLSLIDHILHLSDERRASFRRGSFKYNRSTFFSKCVDGQVITETLSATEKTLQEIAKLSVGRLTR